jgi:homoaconitase/3-isopropylmalate dehydratase large subunit
MRVRVDGKLPENVTAKDIILAIIGDTPDGAIPRRHARDHPRT